MNVPEGYVELTDFKGRKIYFKAVAHVVFVDPPEKCKRCGGSGKIGGGFHDLDGPEQCGCFNGEEPRTLFPDPRWEKPLNDALQQIILKSNPK